MKIAFRCVLTKQMVVSALMQQDFTVTKERGQHILRLPQLDNQPLAQNVLMDKLTI